jgi:hypothetical protein
MPLVILAHYLDPDRNAYVVELVEKQTVTDVVPVHPTTEGEPGPDEPTTEEVEHDVYGQPYDIIFVADDERWEGLSTEEIAKAQLGDIAAAYEARQKHATPPREAAPRQDMPQPNLSALGLEPAPIHEGE